MIEKFLFWKVHSESAESAESAKSPHKPGPKFGIQKTFKNFFVINKMYYKLLAIPCSVGPTPIPHDSFA